MVAWNKFCLLVLVSLHFQKNQASKTAEASKEISQTPADQINTAIATKSENTSADTNKGVNDSDSVEAYIWVPIIAILGVAGGATFIIFVLRKFRYSRKCRLTDGTRVSYHSKQTAGDNHPYQIAVDRSSDFCTSKEDGGFQYSNENVQNASTNFYSEINIGSLDSINGYVTISADAFHGENQNVTPEANGTYDKLGTNPIAKTMKNTGCLNAYDHVIAGDRNIQANGTNAYSNLDLGQTDDIQQRKIIIGQQPDGESKIDRNSSRYSVLNDHSFQQYVILEPDGHYIVHE